MPRSLGIIRWAGRLSALVLAAFLLLFIIGEGPPPLWVLAPCLVVLAGLALGWHYELLGALLILAGFAYFNLIELRAHHHFLRFGAFHLLLFPSGLFLLAGLLGRFGRGANLKPADKPETGSPAS